MGFPSNPNLPKQPPKGPPPRLPGAAPAAPPPRPAAAPAAPPGPPVRMAAPPAPRQAPHAHAAQAPAPALRSPGAPVAPKHVVIPGLPENLAQMVEAIELYDALLVEENAMLKAGDSQGVSAILDRKIATTHLYQERLRNVLNDKSTRALDPDQRQKVVALVKSLDDRAKENTLLLKANMNAIEQVIEAVNTAARKMRRREVAYSGAGKIRETYSTVGVSMAFNHTI